MFTIAKIVGIITSMGVGTIIGNAIKATTPAKMGIIKKILVWVGGVALIGVLSDKSATYAEEQVNGITKAVNDIKNPQEA